MDSGSFDASYVEIPKGAFSVHHKSLLHGSAENRSDKTRVCVAINVRSEHSKPLPEKDDMGFLKHLGNPVFSPVIYQNSNQ